MGDFFATGLGFPEGPVRLADGSFLIVEMAPETGWVAHISSDGKEKRVIATTGRPNGLAVDRDGAIWVAETSQRALLKMQMDGSYEIAVDRCDEEIFLFLNDVALGPNGRIYFTDSGIEMETVAPKGELHPDFRSLDYDGRIFEFDPVTRNVRCIDRGFQFTNGLAFSPKGDLYINETLTGNIYRYESRGCKFDKPREIFGNVIERYNAAELKGPDGMKFAKNGSLFVCVFGQGDVTVLDKRGKVSKRIKTTGGVPTNLTFGAPGEKSIYVTEVEQGVLEKIKVGVDGLPLHA